MEANTKTTIKEQITDRKPVGVGCSPNQTQSNEEVKNPFQALVLLGESESNQERLDIFKAEEIEEENQNDLGHMEIMEYGKSWENCPWEENAKEGPGTWILVTTGHNKWKGRYTSQNNLKSKEVFNYRSGP